MKLIHGGFRSGKTSYCLDQVFDCISQNIPVCLISPNRRALARNRHWLLNQYPIDVLKHQIFMLPEEWMLKQYDKSNEKLILVNYYVEQRILDQCIVETTKNIPISHKWCSLLSKDSMQKRILNFFNWKDLYQINLKNIQFENIWGELCDYLKILYIEYCENIKKNRYIRMVDLYQLILHKNNLCVDETYLIFDGFYDFSPLFLSVLDRLNQDIEQLWVSLTYKSESLTYGYMESSYLKLSKMAKEIVSLKPNLDKSTLILYQTHYPHDSLMSTIQKIWTLKQNNISFNKIAIILNPEIDKRHFLITMYENQLPIYQLGIYSLIQIPWIKKMIHNFLLLNQTKKVIIYEWIALLNQYIEEKIKNNIDLIKNRALKILMQYEYQQLLSAIHEWHDPVVCSETLYPVEQFEKIWKKYLSNNTMNQSYNYEEGVHIVNLEELSYGDYAYVFFVGWNQDEGWIRKKNMVFPDRLISKIYPHYMGQLLLKERYYKNLLLEMPKNITLIQWSVNYKGKNYSSLDGTFLEIRSMKYQWMDEDQKWLENKKKRIFESIQKHDHYGGILKLSQEIIEQKFINKNYMYSPSMINDYSDCPFKCYCRHFLKIDIDLTSPFSLNYAEQGTLIHHILDVFYHKKLYDNLIKDHIGSCIQELVNSEYPELEVYEKSYLINIISKFVKNDLDDWNRCGHWKPTYFEWSFDKVQYFDYDGYFIKGKIDRIDISNDNTYAIIYDYKNTSPTISELVNSDVTQLPLYVYAFKKKSGIEKIQGAAYYNYREKEFRKSRNVGIWRKNFLKDHSNLHITVQKKYKEDEWILFFRDIYEKIFIKMKSIREGNFSVKPRKSNICLQCEFKHVCYVKLTNDESESIDG